MKKNLLSMSIAAMIGGMTLAGAANAGVSFIGNGVDLTASNANLLDINGGGIGHIQIIPYFTTQSGNVTLLAITNTDATNGKAVKVRFRSAANSDDVFDFTLFLSPSDIWTASISQSANGLSLMNTADKSCTLPTSVNGTFVTDRLPAVTATFTAEQRASWTREGYIEILNMADVPPTTFATAGATTKTTNPLFTATKHVAGVAPCTAAAFNPLAVDPTSQADAAAKGLDTPSGGLYAWSTIYNATNAFLSWTTEATAINAVVQTAGTPAPGGAAFVTKTPGRGSLVFSPQTSNAVVAGVAGVPNATTASTAAQLTSDPLLAGGVLAAKQFDFPDLSTPYVNNGPAAPITPTTQANTLSASIAVSSVNNDYTTLAAIGSKTDLVFSQPTRRYGVAVNYAVPSLVFNTANQYYSAGDVNLNGLLACVSPVGSTSGFVNSSFDREETGAAGTSFVISPGNTSILQLCGEVSVLSFNNPAPASSVLAATVARSDTTTVGVEGWVNIPTPGLGVGLPILGSTYISARGAVVSGTSTNFGWTVKNKVVFFNP